MVKKLLIFIIILAVLLGFYFVYNYFANSGVKAPTDEFNENQPAELFPKESATSSDFKGPSGPPSVKGPSGPPPSQ